MWLKQADLGNLRKSSHFKVSNINQFCEILFCYVRSYIHRFQEGDIILLIIHAIIILNYMLNRFKQTSLFLGLNCYTNDIVSFTNDISIRRRGLHFYIFFRNYFRNEGLICIHWLRYWMYFLFTMLLNIQDFVISFFSLLHICFLNEFLQNCYSILITIKSLAQTVLINPFYSSLKRKYHKVTRNLHSTSFHSASGINERNESPGNHPVFNLTTKCLSNRPCSSTHNAMSSSYLLVWLYNK